MFELSISVSIPNFDKYPLEIECPKCRLSNWTSIGQIKRRDYIICRGCHSNIFLEDHENKMHRIFKTLERTFKSWEK